MNQIIHKGKCILIGLVLFLTSTILSAQEFFSYRMFILDFENRNSSGDQAELVTELPRLIFSQALRLPEVRFFPGTEYEYFQGHRDDLSRFPGDMNVPENLTLMGSFQKNAADGSLIDIQLQFVTISPYSLFATRKISSSALDTDMLGEDVMKAIAEVLKLELLPSDVVAEALPKMDVDKLTMDELKKEMKELSSSVSGTDRRYDSLSVYESGVGQVNGSFYRKLGSTDAQADLDIAMMNRETAKSAIYDILFNPYTVEIAEPDYIDYPYRPNDITIRLDIAYHLQKTLINDIAELLPFQRIRPQGENYEYLNFRAKYSDIPFQLQREIQRGDYRVIPVVRFVDKQDHTRYLIYDEKYSEVIPDLDLKFPVKQHKQFSQLLTLAASSTGIQLYLKDANQVCSYTLDLPVAVVRNLDRIAVEFVKIDELESYLANVK